MKTSTFMLTTILSAGLASLYAPPAFAADNIAIGAIKSSTSPISDEAVADPRVAAGNFVEHVNYARVALAMKNDFLANQHVTHARDTMSLIKGATAEHLRITEVGSGRVVYQNETEHKYHYFPIHTGPVQVKQMSNGPVWAKNDLAVTDADIVYLTLDLTGDKADKYLGDAETAITAGDFKEADNQLARLTEAVVTVESRTSVPSDKARDNIALAHIFITSENYQGARFALKHADKALDEIQRDDAYKASRPAIIAMRREVSLMQGDLAKKDPTMIQKAKGKLENWWSEMKGWSKSKTSS